MAEKKIMPGIECEKNAYAQISEEEFDAGAVLSVPLGYEGIIWKNAYDFELLSAGEYQLSKYLPKEKKLFGGGKLHGKIGYVNKEISYKVEWGTGQPVVYFDKTLDRAVKVGFSGSFRVKVDMVEPFLHYAREKALKNLSLQTIVNEQSGEFINGLAPALKAHIEKAQLDFKHIPASLSDIAQAAEIRIRPVFSRTGLWLEDFTVTGYLFPENE